nr:iron-containing alcohol dehydrogenase [Butyrivibrio sp.]
MAPYELNMNTHMYFGDNCVCEAINKEKNILGSKVLIVSTGRSLVRLGYIDKLCNYIERDVVVYDKITPNPDVKEIREAIEIGKKNNVTSVIGFGGGSAIDAAKAVAVGIVSEIDIEDFLIQGIEPPNETLPIIAIPTTSGTGA